MAKRNKTMTNNDVQNTTQKTKDRATQIPLIPEWNIIIALGNHTTWTLASTKAKGINSIR